MNTKDDKIQWHPAFDAALQIELGDEAKYLEFESEHMLTKKPMQIDVLVKNDKHVKIRKNIGRIFRQYNIIEYKSPKDDLNIDDFYKTYAYACIYKSDTEAVDRIQATELTISFVCYHYPRAMLNKLERDRGITVESVDDGIYYLLGDAIPIQLIVVPVLSKEKNKNSKLYQALADTIMRANWKEVKEERKMCEALKELFADDLRESELKGRNAGKIEGKIELVIKKYGKGCTVEETAEMLEESPAVIQQIYDVIEQYAPNYNAETIYKALHDEAL